MWNFPVEQNLNSESSCVVFTIASVVFFAGTSKMHIFQYIEASGSSSERSTMLVNKCL